MSSEVPAPLVTAAIVAVVVGLAFATVAFVLMALQRRKKRDTAAAPVSTFAAPSAARPEVTGTQPGTQPSSLNDLVARALETATPNGTTTNATTRILTGSEAEDALRKFGGFDAVFDRGTPATGEAGSLAAELERLAGLHRAGDLTDGEYQRLKTKLIGGLP